MGGLGNQLFQLNFYNYLKRKYPKAKIRINLSYYINDSRHGGYMLNAIRLPIKKLYMTSHYRFVNDKNYVEDFSDSDNILFEGYWQNMRFFNGDTFSFPDVFKGEMNNDSKDILNIIESIPSSVSIHVRSGDYDNDICLGNVSTKAYYNNAVKRIQEIVNNPIFFVFSNNITWTKENIDFGNCTVYYITCNNAPHDAKWDLLLMSKCHYNIISNSSFSWWAQFFNCHKDKKVITPPYWINEESSCFTIPQPNIQKLKYMECVSNIPNSIHDSEAIQFSCITFLEDDPSVLRRTVATILNQTYDSVELLVICNKTLEVNNEFMHLYNQSHKIHFLYKDTTKALEKANGNYIVFVDYSSYFMSNAFEIIDKYLLEHPDTNFLKFSYIDKPTENVHLCTEDNTSRPTINNLIFKKNPIIRLFNENSFTTVNSFVDFLSTNNFIYKNINTVLLNNVVKINPEPAIVGNKRSLFYYFKRLIKELFH